MRLWHYRLLPYLDDFHIVAQYRELLAIKRAIDKNGTPNHRLVNKVLDYSLLDFKQYTFRVAEELHKRKIKFVASKLGEIMIWECDKFGKVISHSNYEDTHSIYYKWHNKRYLIQCYYNLEEKYDCGIVSEKAFSQIKNFVLKNFVKGEFWEWIQ